MKYLVIPALVCLCLNTLSVHAESNKGFNKQASSSVSETFDKTVRVRKIDNQRFDFSRFFNKDSVTEILLAQSFTRVEREDMEAIAASGVKVSAFTSDKGHYDHLLWSIEDEAEEGILWEEFYKTIKYGCCAQETTYKLFDLKTGRLLTLFTGELARLTVLGVAETETTRLIAYLSSAASLGFDENAADAIGTLTLSSDKGVEDKIILLSNNENYEINTPQVQLVAGKQTQNLLVLDATQEKDKKVIPSYSVLLTFNDGQTLQLLIQQDKFDIAHPQGTAKVKAIHAETE
ncbi:hypothetical protein BegalDRAFT_2195 [Beggiatoa alba B18LD]|uniref:Uncharacterized protein n=1 Tax=Beggiatoa alba B18LD TaxID=395493 RepID=I3CHG2_9GAMM|nr:hypothetical protein [Beggiatoa alba]EIJ43055.1 hypothetical protein BegalDRAFT_2195 [Beggiatoa alba B18LD]